MTHEECELLRFDLRQIQKRLQRFYNFTARNFNREGLEDAQRKTDELFSILDSAISLVSGVVDHERQSAAGMN